MIKNRLARHLTVLIVAKVIVLAVIWAAFFPAPPLDPETHLFPAPPARDDRP